MKKLTGILIGLTSSLLTVAGLFRVAEKFDPLSHAFRGVEIVGKAGEKPAENCTLPTQYLPPETDSKLG
jgi:hypothetical protein